jgi:hypothetical protein
LSHNRCLSVCVTLTHSARHVAARRSMPRNNARWKRRWRCWRRRRRERRRRKKRCECASGHAVECETFSFSFLCPLHRSFLLLIYSYPLNYPPLTPRTVMLLHVVVFCVLLPVLFTILSSLSIYSYPISPTGPVWRGLVRHGGSEWVGGVRWV